MIQPHNILLVHALRSHRGKVERHYAGKLLFGGGQFAVLSDPRGYLSDFPEESPLTPEIRTRVEALAKSRYWSVKPKTSFTFSTPQELPPNTQPAQDSPAFDYQHEPNAPKQVAEVKAGKLHLDGRPLDDQEASAVLSRIRQGQAQIRYRADPLQKREEFFMDLTKAEQSQKNLAETMEHLRQLVSQGHLPPEHYENVRRELFADEMVPTLGNRRAFQEHLQRGPRGGVYVACDLDYLKSINDTHGHEAGDRAIQAAGGALRLALDKTAGKDSKAWRQGGDEFAFLVPTEDHAHQVLRQLRTELESVPAIGGTHRLSMSAGIGQDYSAADKALYGAKAVKEQAVREAGGDPRDRAAKVRSPHSLHVFNGMPGKGAVGLGEQPPLRGMDLGAQPADQSLGGAPAAPVAPADVGGGSSR